MKRILITLLIPFTFFSCFDGELTADDLLPDASGERGHILILMEDNLWEGTMGDNLRAQLDQNIDGPFIRSEPMFDFYQKRPGTLTHINKSSRIILKIFVDREAEFSETQVIEKYDFYAKGQLFLVIKDSDINRLYSFVATEFRSIIDLMNDFELHQLIATYKGRYNAAIKEQCENKFGSSIWLPKTSEIKEQKKDFMWVKNERSRNFMSNEANNTDGGTFWIQQGIVFWTEPYTEQAMDPMYILQKRDTILKYNIPGKLEDSWMATEYDPCCAPEARKIILNGNDCVVFEGNWNHDGNPGAVGGGPFVQYSVHNKSANTVLTVCGYIYAPKFDKREYIRELHAMLCTIETKI
jgi:Domain of unknown function (DUF4837)